MVAQSDSAEVTSLVKRMAAQPTYEEAWMIGLEIQSFSDAAINALQQVLQQGSDGARRAAAFWLSDEAETIPASVFLDISEDADDDIRYYAAYGLGYAKHKEVLPRLRKMMLEDISAEVRQTAAHSMYPAAQLNGTVDEIIDDFAFVLKNDTSVNVREEVATCLSYFLGTDAVHKAVKLLVETALQDPTPSVQEQARISLSILRNEHWTDKTDKEIAV